MSDDWVALLDTMAKAMAKGDTDFRGEGVRVLGVSPRVVGFEQGP
jgi:hypothetical protein